MTRVLVAGALASKPGNGGAAWTRLSWTLGFERVGCEAWLVEQRPRHGRGEDFFHAVARRFGVRAVLLDDGPLPEELPETFDLLVNVSGHLVDPRVRRRARRSAYLDLDPGFTQLWADGARLEGHDLYLTVGALLGRRDCPVPTGGVDWRPVRQPVLLDEWPVVEQPDPGRLTTVGAWRGPFGPLQHDGAVYGLKVHEFRRIAELPRLVPQRLELALELHEADAADRALLESNGWLLADPAAVAGDPDAFRAYVRGSGGELSVAQGVYVGLRTGWFSDRTTRYLASGLPVLVQDTGFSRTLPVGEGLLAFSTLEEAAAGARALAADHARHARAARALAEEHFDARRVLARVLEDAL